MSSTSHKLAEVMARLDKRRDASINDLSEFLRIPSVSVDPGRAGDVAACAKWLAAQFRECGLTAGVESTAGHPIVLARNEHRTDRPTVLIYGHYDVQPPDPMDQWITPPFEPTVRKTAAGTSAIHARGAADDKGQIWAHMEAIRGWQECGGVPVNLMILIEGEEEIDSHHLADFVKIRRDLLRADIAVINDTNQFARGMPAITTGLRGLVYSEVTFTLAANDLHSGIHGGAVINPAMSLSRALSKLQDDTGRVSLEGFYDAVVPGGDKERASWTSLRFDENAYAADLGLRGGLQSLSGEQGFSSIERRWVRPTCDICGITAGYQGAGAKTIVPAIASAKVSFRLVPDQDPLRIRAAFEKFMRDRCPAGLVVSFAHFAAAPATTVPADGPWMRAAISAVEHGFGIKPVLIRDGLTIPVVNLLRRELSLDTLLIGFGLPDDRPHAPNEKFDLDALHAGARTVAAFLEIASGQRNVAPPEAFVVSPV